MSYKNARPEPVIPGDRLWEHVLYLPKHKCSRCSSQAWLDDIHTAIK